MVQLRKKRIYKDDRVNVQLRNEEEKQLYRNLKSLATVHGLTVHDVVLLALDQAVATLEKRTLPPNTPIRLSKKKGRVIQQEEE